MNLVGSWMKLSQNDCSKKYPDQIEVRPNGCYQAKASVQEAMIPAWEAGRFEIAGHTVKLSTSNGVVDRYSVTFYGETIGFTDSDGCTTTYKRLLSVHLI